MKDFIKIGYNRIYADFQNISYCVIHRVDDTRDRYNFPLAVMSTSILGKPRGDLGGYGGV
jgi:hypothetical protein